MTNKSNSVPTEITSTPVGISNHPTAEGPVDFEGPFTFDPKTEYKVDCRVSGRYHSIRMRGNKWRLSNILVAYNDIGSV